MNAEPAAKNTPTGGTLRPVVLLGLVLLPVAVASALVHRARLDWAYCLAAAEGSAPRHATPGLLSSETLSALVPSSWGLVAVVALAFAGVAILAARPNRAGLGLLGWAGLFAALVAMLIEPGALHACDHAGMTGESRLLFLVPAGWGFTLAASLFDRRQSR